jgi:primosomal protein N' (replication factor Y)
VAAATGDRTAFYDAELGLRERFGSPPYGRLVKLTVGLPDPAAAEREATAMAQRLRERAAERGAGVIVVGPAPAYIARRADRWRWNVVLRGADPVSLLDGGLEAPWSVDVDPESLL